MGIFRKLVAWFLVMLIFICEILLMGIFAVDTATSTKSIEDGLNKSQLVQELTAQAIARNTVNGGGIYGAKVKEIAQSEAMGDFFAEYISNSIRTSIYHRQNYEVANDELMAAVDKGIDEVNQNSSTKITADEKALFMVSLNAILPNLTDRLSKVMSNYTLTSGSANETIQKLEKMATLENLMEPRVKWALIGILVSLAILVMLLSSDGKGGIRMSIVTIVAAGLYGVVGFIGYGAPNNPADIFLSTLIQNGSKTVAIAGAVAAAILLIIGIIMSVRKGRMEEY